MRNERRNSEEVERAEAMSDDARGWVGIVLFAIGSDRRGLREVRTSLWMW